MHELTKHHATPSRRASSPFFGPTNVYPKLTINAPGDQFEQEADSMADKVMTMPDNDIQRKCAECEAEEQVQRQEDEEENVQMMPLMRQETEEEENVQMMPLMRQATGGGYEASQELGDQLQASKGDGSPLPDQTLTSMNQAFGTDFSGVRVHTGQQASAMSGSIQAKAFTHGSNIYFNRGQYSPGSSAGKKLLAHELTHVVQQGADGR